MSNSDTANTITSLVLISIEIIGILFNVLTIFITKKQGYNTIDMILIACTGVCDILLMTFTSGIWIYSRINGDRFYDNIIFGQVDGTILSTLLMASMMSVGYLALARCWVLVFKKRINNVTYISLYIFNTLLFIAPLIVVGIRNEYIRMPFNAYYFTPFSQGNVYNKLAYCVLFFVNTSTILLLAVCYTLLTRKFFSEVDYKVPYTSGLCRDYFKGKANQKKVQTLIRTVVALFLYGITIIPSALIMLKEIITQQERHYIEDAVFLTTLCSFTVVNPLALILLHEDSSKLAMSYLNRMFKRK